METEEKRTSSFDGRMLATKDSVIVKELEGTKNGLDTTPPQSR